MTRLYEPAPAGAQGRRLAWRLAGEVRPYWRSALVIFFVNLAAVPLVLLTPVPLKIAETTSWVTNRCRGTSTCCSPTRPREPT